MDPYYSPYGTSTLSLIFGIVSALLMGVSIFQFIFFRKEKRRYEADTKKREEEAKQSEAGTKQAEAETDSKVFANYKEQMDFFIEKYNESMAEKIALMDENFSLKQKSKEDNYRIDTLERKVAGIQRTVEENIKRYNAMSVEMELIAKRANYAESNICLNHECTERIPTLGTFKQKEDERIG